jgi:hypothetical protein
VERECAMERSDGVVRASGWMECVLCKRGGEIGDGGEGGRRWIRLSVRPGREAGGGKRSDGGEGTQPGLGLVTSRAEET